MLKAMGSVDTCQHIHVPKTTHAWIVRANTLMLDFLSEYGANWMELLLKTVWFALMIAQRGIV